MARGSSSTSFETIGSSSFIHYGCRLGMVMVLVEEVIGCWEELFVEVSRLGV